jgi:hypothetical protein
MSVKSVGKDFAVAVSANFRAIRDKGSLLFVVSDRIRANVKLSYLFREVGAAD